MIESSDLWFLIQIVLQALVCWIWYYLGVEVQKSRTERKIKNALGTLQGVMSVSKDNGESWEDFNIKDFHL